MRYYDAYPGKLLSSHAAQHKLYGHDHVYHPQICDHIKLSYYSINLDA